MAIVGSAYLGFVQKLVQGSHDFDNDAFYVQLHTSSYVPDQMTDFTRSDTTNEVASGSGYTTGGELLAVTTGYDDTNGIIPISFADTTWTTLTATFRYAVVYNSSAADRLVAWYDFGSDQSPVAENYTIIWPTAGALGVQTGVV